MHTPGPWKSVMQFGEWHVRQDPKDWDGNGYQFICSLPTAKKKTHYGDMFAANAKAIAAVPDFMEAASIMTAAEDSGGDLWWKGFEMLKAAYAKAGGQFPSMQQP